jgi:uncharacterized protein YhbP (UPF0306 family)
MDTGGFISGTMTKKKIISYIKDCRVMQLATSRENKPWVCSVYYVHDESLNLYWLSLPTRRHSQEISINPNVSIAIAVKQDLPVIGIQAEGQASKIESLETVKRVMQKYVDKYGEGGDYYENFIARTNKHQLYMFKPSKFYLFDEYNFSGKDSQQHIDL